MNEVETQGTEEAIRETWANALSERGDTGESAEVSPVPRGGTIEVNVPASILQLYLEHFGWRPPTEFGYRMDNAVQENERVTEHRQATDRANTRAKAALARAAKGFGFERIGAGWRKGNDKFWVQVGNWGATVICGREVCIQLYKFASSNLLVDGRAEVVVTPAQPNAEYPAADIALARMMYVATPLREQVHTLDRYRESLEVLFSPDWKQGDPIPEPQPPRRMLVEDLEWDPRPRGPAQRLYGMYGVEGREAFACAAERLLAEGRIVDWCVTRRVGEIPGGAILEIRLEEMHGGYIMRRYAFSNLLRIPVNDAEWWYRELERHLPPADVRGIQCAESIGHTPNEEGGDEGEQGD